jgi:hypothetical protein
MFKPVLFEDAIRMTNRALRIFLVTEWTISFPFLIKRLIAMRDIWI